MTADDWTEKYRPQSLAEVVGNPTSAATMKQWAQSWDKGIPEYRALVLIGTPGIGKTSSAEALAKEMGWGVVEMNASDQRTGSIIEDVATRASNYNTFDDNGGFLSTRESGRKLIILDEADSLYGIADKGAMPAIVDLIENTRQPVILICNDFYEMTRKSSSIKTKTMQITFRKPQAATIEKVIKKICAKERVPIEDAAISKIAENADGDLRAAIRDLQSLALGKEMVTADMAARLSERESRSDMFEFLGALFNKRDAALAKKLLRECDVDPPTALLWIEENLPHECATKKELADCYDALSKADVYLGRVKKRMYYGLWSYANDMMVDGVASCLTSRKVTFGRMMFPQFLSKMSRSRSSRAMRTSVASKLGRMCHTSYTTVLRDSMPMFQTLAADDEEFRVVLVKEGGLDEDELGFLLGCKGDSKIVKSTFLKAFPPEPKPEKKKTTRAKAPKAAELKMPEKKPETASDVQKHSEPALAAPSEPVKETFDVAPAAPKETPKQEAPAAPKAKQRSLFDF